MLLGRHSSSPTGRGICRNVEYFGCEFGPGAVFHGFRAFSLEGNLNPTAIVCVSTWQQPPCTKRAPWRNVFPGFFELHFAESCMCSEFDTRRLKEGSFSVQTQVSHMNVRWFCAITTSFEAMHGPICNLKTWSLHRRTFQSSVEQFSCLLVLFSQVVGANVQYLLVPVPY